MDVARITCSFFLFNSVHQRYSHAIYYSFENSITECIVIAGQVHSGRSIYIKIVEKCVGETERKKIVPYPFEQNNFERIIARLLYSFYVFMWVFVLFLIISSFPHFFFLQVNSRCMLRKKRRISRKLFNFNLTRWITVNEAIVNRMLREHFRNFHDRKFPFSIRLSSKWIKQFSVQLFTIVLAVCTCSKIVFHYTFVRNHKFSNWLSPFTLRSKGFFHYFHIRCMYIHSKTCAERMELGRRFFLSFLQFKHGFALWPFRKVGK